MDENAFRDAWRSANPIPCVFERVVLAGRCRCQKVVRINLAEREAAGCSSAEAQGDCGRVLDALRHNALFALRLTHLTGALPFPKELKVQAGGLLGLRNALFPEDGEADEDAFTLIQEALRRFGGVENLPYSEIVKAIAAFEPRKRR